jgi:L,D-peptidoglycan transpeptidase YkuD (ErfK/YbiS/YcfS/YnhG family)
MSPASGRHAKPRTPAARRTAAAGTFGTVATAATLLASNTAFAATSTPVQTPEKTYTVKVGDTLSGIAATEHVPGGWAALAKANHIASPYIIRPGENLALPAGSYILTTPSAPSPFPVPVTVGTATQAITVKAHGSYATVTAWQKGGSTWTKVLTTSAARIGANGVTNGATREQCTDTTPTGTYTLTHAFGVATNPGTKMPYHQVTSTDWWVEDPTSAYYNQMRSSALGGFHLTETGPDGSEHLINYPTQYHNALVVNYNMNPAVKGRGAGIFLHDLGPEGTATGGCVAGPAAAMTSIMKWINPTDHPVIAIG